MILRHDTSPAQEDQAIRLVLAVKRLSARLRETWPSPVQALPTTQPAILKHLRDDGPTSAAALAAAEHVAHQAIARHVAALCATKLVSATRDPKDGHKSLARITAHGLTLFDAVAESRNAWLRRANAAQISAREQASLAKDIDLLERLASSDVGLAG